MFTFTHLSTGGQLDRQRQRDLLARADQQRLVRQLREHARTSRRTERAGGSPACSSAPAQRRSPREPRRSCQQPSKLGPVMAALIGA